MITKAEAGTQVARMGQMFGYPKNEKEALNELVVAAQAAKDLATCRKVIDGYIETAAPDTRCPMPADIRGAMYAAEKPSYWQPEWGAPVEALQAACATCGDSGIHGGTGAADPWRWCSCEAAGRTQRSEPTAVEDANRTLNKILRRNTLQVIA